MKNILLHIRTRRQSMSKSRMKFINTRAIRDSLNLSSLDNDRWIAVTHQSRFSNMNVRYWCFVENLAMTITCSKLISTLTTFIRQKRRTMIIDNVFDRYRRNKDFSWAKQCQISIHSSLTYWIRDETNALNMNHLIQKKIRYQWSWQNRLDKWRRDFVWARESNDRQDDSMNAINDKLLKSLHVIVTVQDSEKTNDRSLFDTAKHYSNYCDHETKTLSHSQRNIWNDEIAILNKRRSQQFSNARIHEILRCISDTTKCTRCARRQR